MFGIHMITGGQNPSSQTVLKEQIKQIERELYTAQRSSLKALKEKIYQLKQTPMDEVGALELSHLETLMSTQETSLFTLYQFLLPEASPRARLVDFEASDLEWAEAEEFFQAYPDAVKYEKLHKGLHSFIKFEDKICVIQSRHDFDVRASFKQIGEKGVGVDCIGEGATAKVKRVKDKQGQLFALKIIGFENSIEERHYYKNEKEVEVRLGGVQAESFRPYGKKPYKIGSKIRDVQPSVPTKYKRYQLQHLWQGQELYDILNDEMLKENKTVNFKQQFSEYLLLALREIARMHHRGVLHRDIKPENLLVSMEERGPQVRAIDKAMSICLPVGKNESERCLLGCGSADYVDFQHVQVIEKTSTQETLHFVYNRASDLYAFGKMVSLVAEYQIFPMDTFFINFEQAACSPNLKKRKSNLELQGILSDSLKSATNLRPSAKQLLEDIQQESQARVLIQHWHTYCQDSKLGDIYLGIEQFEVVSFNLSQRQAESIQQWIQSYLKEAEEVGRLFFEMDSKSGRYGIKLNQALIENMYRALMLKGTKKRKAEVDTSSTEEEALSSAAGYLPLQETHFRKYRRASSAPLPAETVVAHHSKAIVPFMPSR